MALFDVKGDQEQREASNPSFIDVSKGFTAFINAASLKLFKEQLKNIEPGSNYHFCTGGQWSLHELVAYLVAIVGPCDLWKCTWAISEDSIRSLLDLRERKMVNRIRCLYSYKITENKTKAYQLAAANFDVTLCHIHAKVTVLHNENWCISVSGSQNDTRNPRIERGVICTDEKIAKQDIEWMQQVIAGNNPFKVKK